MAVGNLPETTRHSEGEENSDETAIFWVENKPRTFVMQS